MADKGKRVMSAEELKWEQEQQESRRIQDLVDSWLETQESDPKPPAPLPAGSPSYPPGFAPRPLAIRPPSQGFSPQPPTIGTSSQTPPAPGSPTYTPSQVVTNWVTQKALNAYWVRKGPPEGIGPWFRLDGGFIRFRFGTSWVLIDREERIAAQERADARAAGVPVPEQPPPKRGDELILRLTPAPGIVPIPSSSDEEDENDFDPGEDSSTEDDENIPVGSDTSTVTEEPTEVSKGVKEDIRRFFFGKKN